MKRYNYTTITTVRNSPKVFKNDPYFENYESDDDEMGSFAGFTCQNVEEPLEIFIDDIQKKSRVVDVEKSLIRRFIVEKLKRQRCAHQINILLLLARGRYWNRLSSEDLIRGVALSFLLEAEPTLKFPCEPTVARLQRIYLFCRNNFKVHRKSCRKCKCFLLCLQLRKMCCPFSFVWLYAALVRALDFEVRVVMSLDALPLKLPASARRVPSLNIKKLTAEFSPQNPERTFNKVGRLARRIGVFRPRRKYNDFLWVEVYDPSVQRWRIIDVRGDGMNSVGGVGRVYSPMVYVVSINNDNEMTDLTPKYCPKWPSRGCRLHYSWLAPLFHHFRERTRLREVTPFQIPRKMCAFLDHPDYILDRFIGKTQCIFPPTRPICQIGDYGVYPRGVVRQLRGEERWLRMGRQLKEGEAPYRVMGKRTLYGEWQTQEFVRAVARDGVVPRNRYGNVYVLREEMLPAGTVHLKYAGIEAVAREMGVDVARAMVGWEFRGGSCQPRFEGFVVCAEEAGRLIDEYEGKLRSESEEMRKELVMCRWRRIFHYARIRIRVMEKFGLSEL